MGVSASLCQSRSPKRLGLPAVGSGHDHSELVATQPRRDEPLVRRAVQYARKVSQDDVADEVSELVVDGLEVIDVKHEDGERPLLASARSSSAERRS